MRSNGKTGTTKRRPTGPEKGKRAQDTLANIALAALRRGVADLGRLRDSIRQSPNPDAVHDMRVTIRQMRASIRVAGAELPKGLATLDLELAWIFDSLGVVRDADIAIQKLGLHEDAGAILSLLAVDRDDAAAALQGDLDSHRYARLLVALAALTDESHHVPQTPALAVAPDLVAAEFRRVRKGAAKLDKSSPEAAVHRVRRRAKRFRYTLDLFRGLYGTRADKMIAELRAFQDLLGSHQDCAMIERRMRSMANSNSLDPDAEHLAKQIASECAKTARVIRGDFPAAFKRLTRRPWKRLNRRMASRRRAFVQTLRTA